MPVAWRPPSGPSARGAICGAAPFRRHVAPPSRTAKERIVPVELQGAYCPSRTGTERGHNQYAERGLPIKAIPTYVGGSGRGAASRERQVVPDVTPAWCNMGGPAVYLQLDIDARGPRAVFATSYRLQSGTLADRPNLGMDAGWQRGPDVVLTARNRAKRLLDVIQWRPRVYRGNDWRRILQTIKAGKGRTQAAPTAAPLSFQDAVIAAAAPAPATARRTPTSERSSSSCASSAPTTPRQKLHERCRTTLRTPRTALRHAHAHRRAAAAAATADSSLPTAQTDSALLTLLNVTHATVQNVLKQVHEANLLRNGTQRNVVVMRRTRAPVKRPAVAGQPQRHHCVRSSIIRAAGGTGIVASDQDIRFYADEAEEALSMFSNELCHRSAATTTKQVLTRVQFRRFLQRNELDAPAMVRFIDHCMDVITTVPGVMDAVDYFALLAMLLKEVKPNRLHFAYLLYDLDGDGRVSSRDLFELLRMGIHRMFPNDFRILCQLVNDQADKALNEKRQQRGHAAAAAAGPVDDNRAASLYQFYSEKGVNVRLSDWQQKNRGRQHSDIAPFLARILYDQFRDEDSPSCYGGLDGLFGARHTTVSTKIFSTTRALNAFKRQAASGTKLKTSLEKMEATAEFTRDEVQVLMSTFWKATGGRGYMTRRELLPVLAMFEIDESAAVFFQRAFDPENRNSIEFESFLTSWAVVVHGDTPSRLDMLFTMFDFDRNGTIRADEMFAVMECRWGQTIRDSLDNLLDAVVDKFNAADNPDPSITNVGITKAEYDRVMVDIPEFWTRLAARVNQILQGRVAALRHRTSARRQPSQTVPPSTFS
ncbi:unnamed protein product (mitochondrion) [Plasmodiophora brassicae]|uniref:EF-hand domain-containing protein n=1 Tax=Plasmodiophora brassicae TaxID=37360 RepID=A0A3P3YBN1_PLABS|nr:unnamed protein product [Plasmodiophora brassicae]